MMKKLTSLVLVAVLALSLVACGKTTITLDQTELVLDAAGETALLTAREASEALCEMLEAEPVQCIGSKLVLYKANPEKPGIVLPKEK